jgi:hypothetical protein
MTLKERARSWLGIPSAQQQVRADRERTVRERVRRQQAASTPMGGAMAAMETLIEEKFDVLTCLAGIATRADELLDCLNEFAPEYPKACNECAEALDAALARGEASHYFTRKPVL